MKSIWKLGAGVVLAGGMVLSAAVLHRHHRTASLGHMLEFSSPAQAAVPPTVIGMNLGPNFYWQSVWIFNDIVQSTGNLRVSQNGWQEVTNQIKLDTGGHPVDVRAGTQLVFIIQLDEPRIPVGTYHCLVSKGWDVRAFGGWTKQGSDSDFVAKITNAPDPRVALMLTARQDHADLKQLSCLPEKGDPAQVFNPTYVEDTKPYRVIRFMDWMHTNAAPPRVWADRPTPASLSQATTQGVALEHMVGLANISGSDPWFNMPLDADSGYYRAFATYVRDHLSPDRKVYVELSNEVWNTSFQQGKDAVLRGKILYPGEDANHASDYYYGDRVRDLMGIWSDVFRGHENRLVRVLASQAVNPARAQQALSHKDTWRSVDALATAPYIFPVDDVNAMTGNRVDAIFKTAPRMIDAAISHALESKRTASQYRLRYITYEGGPHFFGYSTDLLPTMTAVNEDPRMAELYRSFLRRWQAEVGDLFVAFTSHSTGAFGIKKYTGQPVAEAPRARVLMEFMPHPQETGAAAGHP